MGSYGSHPILLSVKVIGTRFMHPFYAQSKFDNDFTMPLKLSALPWALPKVEKALSQHQYHQISYEKIPISVVDYFGKCPRNDR